MCIINKCRFMFEVLWWLQSHRHCLGCRLAPIIGRRSVYWFLIWSLHCHHIGCFHSGVQIFKCNRTHSSQAKLIGVGFNLRLFSFQTGFLCVCHQYILILELGLGVWQLIPPNNVFCLGWWWVMVVEQIFLIECHYLFLLNLKPHWLDWCVIERWPKRAID